MSEISSEPPVKRRITGDLVFASKSNKIQVNFNFKILERLNMLERSAKRISSYTAGYFPK